jgi:hypothetical protein
LLPLAFRTNILVIPGWAGRCMIAAAAVRAPWVPEGSNLRPT